MRIDLTLLSPDGTTHDVAVLAPAGMSWGDVAPALVELRHGGPFAWAGRERLRADMIIGEAPLVSGAVLTTKRTPQRRNGPRLAVVGGQAAGREVPIGDGELTAGRDQRCALVLADPRVSRRHAAFRVDGAQLVVRDLGSTHGTEIDGRIVLGPTVVARGALVRVGNTFLGRAGDVEPPPTPTQVVVAAPAATPTLPRPRVQLLAALTPAAAGAVMALALQSPVFLLLAALTPVTVLAGAGSERWHWNRIRRRSRARADRQHAAFTRQLAQAVADDAVARRAADPDPAALVRIAAQRSARLWERVRDGPRGVSVRVGLAELPTRVSVERGGRVEPAERSAVAPVVVDLTAGSVAVIAPQHVRDALARAMLVALATLYPPTDVELAVVSAAPDRWAWVRWLPHWHGVATVAELARHVRSPRAQLVLLVDGGAADPGEFTVDPATALILLSATTTPRTRRAARRIIAGVDGSGATAGDGAVARLEQAAQSAPTEPTAGALDGVDVVLDGVDVDTAETLARSLAPLRQRVGSAADVPAECALVDLLGLDGQSLEPARLVADIRARWSEHDSRLQPVLGRTSRADPISVDLAADGPHLLVAGTTGSGKSELLQTLVVGLAVQQPPSRATFLLIDYKGGAAFAACAALPHVVGVVTDLDDHLTSRVLASLESEIVRRERVLAAARVGHADALAHTAQALSRLVIVVDEFATLADELPGFVSGLVAVAQRGRSLGLHLVLATQRPAGVVSPEIRANTALRICLRVTDPADSTDVLGSPEAAAISRQQPGRAYLRRGGELVEFQAARVAGVRGSGRSTAPRVVDLDRWRRLPPQPVRDEVVTDLQRLVDAVGVAGAQLPPPHRPWVDVLPARLTLADLASGPPPAVPIGLVDRPREQRHDVLCLTPGDTVLVAGRPRSGRTSALRTIAAAFSGQHPASDLHVYAVDATGDELRGLRSLPHAGTIACAGDGFDLTARLVARLADLFTTRRGATQVRPSQLLLLVDGWEQLAAASQTHDGGRTADSVAALLRDAPAAGATVVVTGGRAALAARLTAHVRSRLLLTLSDAGDYLLAGVDRASVPPALPGRGVRAGDGCEFQIAERGAPTPPQHPPATATIRLRPLPAEVGLASIRSCAPPAITLGLAGDAAEPVHIDLRAGARRMLVAGPPGSGRSTTLHTLLAGAVRTSRPVLVAGPPRSPLASAARALGVRAAGPGDEPDLVDDTLVLVDDAELFADTPLAARVADWAAGERAGSLVVAARSDLLAVTFRGLAWDVRSAGCGVLLRPAAADGALLGVDLPAVRPARIAGRGVLVPDRHWGLGGTPLPVQIAAPLGAAP